MEDMYRIYIVYDEITLSPELAQELFCFTISHSIQHVIYGCYCYCYYFLLNVVYPYGTGLFARIRDHESHPS